MAIEFKIAKALEDAKYTHPLTDLENNELNKLEEYVDAEIKKSDVNTIIRINLQNINKVYQKFPKQRFSFLKNEFEKRYTSVGWEIKIKIDDMLDGPNMSGPDYWILTEKK